MMETIRAPCSESALRELQDAVVLGGDHEERHSKHRDSIHEAEQASNAGERRLVALCERTRKMNADLIHISAELEVQEHRAVSMVESIRATANEPIWATLREMQEALRREHEQLQKRYRESVQEAEQAAREGENRFACLWENGRSMRENMVQINLELDGQELRTSNMLDTIRVVANEPIWQAFRELQEFVARGSDRNSVLRPGDASPTLQPGIVSYVPANVLHVSSPTRRGNVIGEQATSNYRLDTSPTRAMNGASVQISQTTSAPGSPSQPATFSSPLQPSSAGRRWTASANTVTRSPASDPQETQSPSATTGSPSFERRPTTPTRQPRLRKQSQAEVSRPKVEAASAYHVADAFANGPTAPASGD